MRWHGFGCPRLARGSLPLPATHGVPILHPFPRGGFAAAGERERFWGSTYSEKRNDPPDKPGAFVTSQNKHQRSRTPIGTKWTLVKRT